MNGHSVGRAGTADDRNSWSLWLLRAQAVEHVLGNGTVQWPHDVLLATTVHSCSDPQIWHCWVLSAVAAAAAVAAVSSSTDTGPVLWASDTGRQWPQSPDEHPQHQL